MILYEIGILFTFTFAIFLLVNAIPLKTCPKISLYLTVMISTILLIGVGNLERQKEIGAPKTAFTTFIQSLPKEILILLILNEILLFIWLYKNKKTTLTPWSSKESIDYLPDGVCFSTIEGMPILVNEQMNKLCSILFKCSVMNVEKFWNQLTKISEIKTYNTIILKVSNEFWEFKKIQHKNIYELIARNITESYKLKQELEKKNQTLQQINERLIKFGKEMEQVTREQEILNAKILVHDDIGRSLLAARVYLEQPQEKRNRKQLLALWNYVISVMKQETQLNINENWNSFLRMAKAMSVDILLEGNLPTNKKIQSLFLAAFRECLTNTVKHANGDKLFIQILNDNIVKITNNGSLPKDEIYEKGGLKNLRSMVELNGGKMKITTTPNFCVKIEFLEEKHE